MNAEQQRIVDLVDHWCPKQFGHEDFNVRVIRAFLCATSCAADQKRTIDGAGPVMPPSFYPDPKFGFQ